MGQTIGMQLKVIADLVRHIATKDTSFSFPPQHIVSAILTFLWAVTFHQTRRNPQESRVQKKSKVSFTEEINLEIQATV